MGTAHDAFNPAEATDPPLPHVSRYGRTWAVGPDADPWLGTEFIATNTADEQVYGFGATADEAIDDAVDVYRFTLAAGRNWQCGTSDAVHDFECECEHCACHGCDTGYGPCNGRCKPRGTA